MRKSGKMASHNELGKEGENAAVKYLLEKGYEIRHRNWHSGHRDLDIVAQKDGELVIQGNLSESVRSASFGA